MSSTATLTEEYSREEDSERESIKSIFQRVGSKFSRERTGVSQKPGSLSLDRTTDSASRDVTV